MIRTVPMTFAALALMSSAAFAQGAPNGPPATLSGADRSYDARSDEAPSYADRDDNQARNGQDASSRDLFCRRDAAARTGYVTPDQAARRAQTGSSLGGAIGGAALGAIIGGANHNAGAGALIGAGAGLIAGTAVGSANARDAARDVDRAYSDAYYACMDAEDRGPDQARQYAPDAAYGRDYAYGPEYSYGPRPYAYGPGYYAPYPYYARPYYQPSFSLGFSFGGGGHRGHGGFGRHR